MNTIEKVARIALTLFGWLVAAVGLTLMNIGVGIAFVGASIMWVAWY